ncbi:RHS repeat-associated core domain-containing protein [Paenibacillus sp. 19GGS1-52]|uniref:RHS repeat domain-containing protein n=1 Tax=Paenibacillus sp. 19GGS1-52 TaxID=2758563 RepID=UPI001EFB476C|nr:RHS repeat-associated core domain-containing protein [Paenibacillus sp. 19GGS1-52]ULO09514.1 RHS repeat-associated core domain-containing protein [Paenibacillus sp. 19GGS1-52]
MKESSTGTEATQAQYTYTGSVLDTITYGNGFITQYLYEDGFGRLTGMKHLKGSTILNQYSYTYDNNGNITERTSNGQTVTFGYDELDRIIASSEANEQYSYDVKGNRMVQLSTASSLHTDTMDYTYDQANQLKSVTRNGTATTYKYDGDGLMREKNNGNTTRFYYDGENIIAEGSISGSTVSFKARYVRGYQLISMKNQWGTVGYYLENGHGDVVNLYKQDQTLLNTYDYDLWGNPKVTEEADQYNNPFRYAGEYGDTNTGLQNLRARWYDPSIGRFITEDTWEGRINHPDSQNPYVYVVNNPLIYVDPSGHIFDVIFDIASLAYDTYQFVQDPSWENVGYMGLDVAAAAIPFVPSASAPLRSLNKVDDVSDAVSSVAKVSGNARTFTSPDKYVGETATAIEAKYPGRVVDVNKNVYRPDGTKLTDYDIELDNAIIQVKSGSGKGATGQASRTASSSNKEVIIYLPDQSPNAAVVKGAQKEGFKVFTNQDDLINYVGR